MSPHAVAVRAPRSVAYSVEGFQWTQPETYYELALLRRNGSRRPLELLFTSYRLKLDVW